MSAQQKGSEANKVPMQGTEVQQLVEIKQSFARCMLTTTGHYWLSKHFPVRFIPAVPGWLKSYTAHACEKRNSLLALANGQQKHTTAFQNVLGVFLGNP